MTYVVRTCHPDYCEEIDTRMIESPSIDEAVAQVTETMGRHHVFDDGDARIIVVPYGLTYVVEEATL